MSVKIVVISDTHTKHRDLNIPPCDFLIHAGDACGWGRIAEFADFASWFEQQNQAKNRIYVPGNHDRIVESDPGLCRGMMPNSHMLINDVIRINGICIYGCAYTPEFYGWAFQGYEEGRTPGNFRDLRDIYETMPFDTDIAICHGPFRGVADLNSDGESCGSIELLRRIRSVEPKLFICGHIHESYGIHHVGGGYPLVVNAAIDGKNQPIVMHYGAL